MLKNILYKLNVLLDTLKGFLIFIIVWALIIIFGAVIVHNILKMGDVLNNYKGDYKKLVEVDQDKMMNVLVVGEGERTIVILPSYGMQSPVIQYKAIANKLKDEYRVAIVEYYGYGFSMNTEKERNLDNIADEIKKSLELKEIYEYVLMPHDHSNMYAMKMVEKYPEAVQGIISLNPLFPAQYTENHFYNEYLDEYHNVQLTSILELTGFARILSYVMPEEFYISQMERAGIWTREEILLIRNRIATSYLTDTMVKEMEYLKDNALAIKDFKYPDTLPVLQLLASDTVKEYEDLKSKDLIKKDLKSLANDVITNPELQFTKVLDGNQDFQFTNYNTVAAYAKEFLNNGNVENVNVENPVDILDVENPENVVENIIENDVQEDVENEIISSDSNMEQNDEEPEVEIIDLKPKNETTVKNTVKPTTKPTTNQIYDPDSSRKKASTNSVKNTDSEEDFVITIE